MKTVAIIQARMGSTRLPGKILKELQGYSVLSHVIQRLKQSTKIDEIIIATTTNESDNLVEKEALNCDVKVFRGSETDVLSRYYFAAKEADASTIIRITSDCPLIDPIVTDKIIDFYIDNSESFDIVSNAVSDITQRTYPRGLDTEVFSFNILERAFNEATKSYQREHVTPFIYENGKCYVYKNDKDYSNFRWTLDTRDDFYMISAVYDGLYKGKHNFYMDDIVKYLNIHPKIVEINKNIEQKKLEVEG